MPAVEEVWLNTLHCQFQLTLCCGILLALDPDPGSAGRRRFGQLILFLAPLCGPGAIATLPLFVARSVVDRSVGRARQTLPLAVGSVLQLTLFFHHESVRGYGLDPFLLLDIFTVRHLMLPFGGSPIPRRPRRSSRRAVPRVMSR